MVRTLEFTAHLTASPTEVWAWIVSTEGVAKEMSPYLRMSAPAGLKSLEGVSVRPGEKLFRSWLYLLGVIPVGYSDLTLVSLERGVGFVEQLPMAFMRLWRHERCISPAEPGCILTDKLAFEPQFAGALSVYLVRGFFAHRHRKLGPHLGQLDTL